MSLTKRQIQSMLMAGTIAVPPTFPELGILSFQKGDATTNPHIGDTGVLTVEQPVSPKLVMTRTFLERDVVAVFLPANREKVDLQNGRWFVTTEIPNIPEFQTKDSTAVGIVYVREHAQTLLHVEIGMTAAESVEYYPPLPDDRSVNHYRFDNSAKVQPAGCNGGNLQPANGMVAFDIGEAGCS